MKNIAWKMNRLRAMSAREILHRGLQRPLQRLERWAVSASWSPHPPISVEPKQSLFPEAQGWQAAWQSLYRIDRDGLASLLGGNIDFFGHRSVHVGATVDWHRDPMTGIRSPLQYGKAINYRDDKVVGNVKYVWELGRHQHLVPLAVAYACTGEVKYRDAVISQIDGWIETNPYGMGIHWCSSLELALRLISWSVVHSLLVLRDGEAGLFTAVTDRNAFGRSIYQQAWFVRHYLSRYSSANNHLIGELTGLWIACQVFDLGDIGARWAEFAQHELEQQAKLQVHDDGVDKEQAVYYHLWVLEYLLLAWLTGERCGMPFTNSFRERLVSMAKFLNDIAPPGGRPPQIGDADDGFATRFEATWPQNPYQDVLAAVKHALGARQLLTSGSAIPQKAYWYAMILGKSPEPDAENKTSPNDRLYPIVYREGGYAVLGDKRMHLVFDAGPLGYPSIAAHAHADALSFCLAVRGEWWLVDPGTYSYHSETRWRDYFRGTVSHNTLRVDKTNQSEIGGAFLWLRHALAKIEKYGTDPDGCQWVEGSHDGFSSIGVMHRRRIDFFPQEGKMLITDRIEGNGAHDLDICFHFAPDLIVAPGPHRETWTAAMPGKPDMLEFHVDASWQWDVQRGSEAPLLGWYSSALGSKIPAYTLRGRWQGRTPVSIVTSIVLKN